MSFFTVHVVVITGGYQKHHTGCETVKEEGVIVEVKGQAAVREKYF